MTTPTSPRSLTHADTHAEFQRLIVHGNASIPWTSLRRSIGIDHNVSAAGQWLAAEIKATNGHSRYVPGLVAHIARFEHPLLGSKALFDWWKAERVPAMDEGDFVPLAPKKAKLDLARKVELRIDRDRSKRLVIRHDVATKTITLGAAQRLLAFIRNHAESLDVPSEYLENMTYREGCDALEKCLPQTTDTLAPIPIILAYVIQCFAGVAYVERVKGVEER